jgi:hypothetical protein
MSVRFELTVRIHPLDDVAKKEGVRRETEPVVKRPRSHGIQVMTPWLVYRVTIAGIEVSC